MDPNENGDKSFSEGSGFSLVNCLDELLAVKKGSSDELRIG